jgi:hypothetical protein
LKIDQTHWYKIPDFLELVGEDIRAYDLRVLATQDEFNNQTDEVQAAYKNFRLAVKQQLFI